VYHKLSHHRAPRSSISSRLEVPTWPIIAISTPLGLRPCHVATTRWLVTTAATRSSKQTPSSPSILPLLHTYLLPTCVLCLVWLSLPLLVKTSRPKLDIESELLGLWLLCSSCFSSRLEFLGSPPQSIRTSGADKRLSSPVPCLRI
jgi:hypothetical protein